MKEEKFPKIIRPAPESEPQSELKGKILSYTTVSALMVNWQFHKIPNSTIVHTTTLYLVHV